jgi:hypothetical protein
MNIDYNKIIQNAIKMKRFSLEKKNGISLITYSLKREMATWNEDSVIVSVTGIIADNRSQIFDLFKSLSCEMIECSYVGPNRGLFKLVMPLIQSFTMFDEGFQGELIVCLNPYVANGLLINDNNSGK